MRHDPTRSRPDRPGSPPAELSTAAKAVAAGSALVIGAWLLANPLAGAVVLVAAGVAVLLVGVPLAVVRGAITVHAVLARWNRRDAGASVRVRRDPDADVSDSADPTVQAE